MDNTKVTMADVLNARPISEYHEDMGTVLWWKFPIEEAPYVGSPNSLGFGVVVTTSIETVRDEDVRTSRIYVGGWPGYHTHFTKIIAPSNQGT